MCRSQAEGGQRCYTHTKARLERAEAKFVEASAARTAALGDADGQDYWEWSNPALAAYDEALAEHVDALADHASTTRGREELTARLHARSTLDRERHKIQLALDNGAYRQSRNHLVKRASANGGDLTGLVGTTGYEHIDELVSRALRQVVANPQEHPTAQRFPAVKHYRTAQEQERGVRRWADEVERQAHDYGHALRQYEELRARRRTYQEAGDAEGEQRIREAQGWAKAALRQRAAIVVMAADKLRIAQEREVPSGPGRLIPYTALVTREG